MYTESNSRERYNEYQREYKRQHADAARRWTLTGAARRLQTIEGCDLRITINGEQFYPRERKEGVR